MRRLLLRHALALLLLSLPAVLAACGRGGNSGGDDDDSATDDDDATDALLGVLTLEGDPLDLGTVVLGDSAGATVDVTNDGEGDLTVSLSISGDPGWTLNGDGALLLGPTESASLGATFTPTGDGPSTATISATHDGSNASPQTLTLTGEGSSNQSGSWAVTPSMTYLCDEGNVDIDVTSFTILDNNPAITVQSNSSEPGGMTGNFTGDTAFSVNRNEPAGPLGLNCGEDYTVTGTFTSANSLTGTLNVVFSGIGCVECSNQSWSFTATR